MAGVNTDRSVIRQQRLLSDIDLIIRVCTTDKENPFCSKCFSFVPACMLELGIGLVEWQISSQF